MKKKKQKAKVFVSGCFDLIHAGHIQFFKDAKALGVHLTVCFASKDVLKLYKNRESALPDDNKVIVIGAIRYVDRVVISSNLDPVFDFREHFLRYKPGILAVTEDDKHKEEKAEFCKLHGARLVVLKKKNNATRVSTTDIRSGLINKLVRVKRVRGK